MEELYKSTLHMRGRTDYLSDHYSRRNGWQMKFVPSWLPRSDLAAIANAVVFLAWLDRRASGRLKELRRPVNN